MQKSNKLNYLSAKNLSLKIKMLIENGKEELALALLESKDIKTFLPQIISIMKREKAKKDDFNTCKILSSQEISDEALVSILKFVNYDANDKLVKIVNKDLNVGAYVTYKGISVDATLSTMLKRALEL